VVALVVAASSMTGLPVAEVLEDFGEFIVPDLVKMYGHLLRPEWGTIDVIENTERTIYSVVRVKNPGAKPPELKTVRHGANEVVLFYASPRQMCALAIGIGKGLAKHFNENIVAQQATCMHKGAQGRVPMDITPWMDWFLQCLGRAIDGAQATLGTVLSKAHFWETFGDALLNERQRLVVNRLLDGFEGKLTTMKYGKLAKCSHDTALRDIAALVERGILVRNLEGGRSTSYSLAKVT